MYVLIQPKLLKMKICEKISFQVDYIFGSFRPFRKTMRPFLPTKGSGESADKDNSPCPSMGTKTLFVASSTEIRAFTWKKRNHVFVNPVKVAQNENVWKISFQMDSIFGGFWPFRTTTMWILLTKIIPPHPWSRTKKSLKNDWIPVPSALEKSGKFQLISLKIQPSKLVYYVCSFMAPSAHPLFKSAHRHSGSIWNKVAKISILNKINQPAFTV